nr:zf-CCHC domain-containing protein/RVP_2 domain-containing protein [Tanacetum cinerariifolium]
MKTLAEFMIIVGADNHPPMLEKSLYDSWKSRMELYIENRENGRMVLNSLQNGIVVHEFSQEDDLISCLNKAMDYLTVARVVKCYNCQGEGHMARQCTQPKRLRNTAWFKEKAMLAEARESG